MFAKKLLAKRPASAILYLTPSSLYLRPLSGRVPSGRAIAQYLSGRGEEHIFNTLPSARPERILAHIPHALRLVYRDSKSGDHISTARPECLRAGKSTTQTLPCNIPVKQNITNQRHRVRHPASRSLSNIPTRLLWLRRIQKRPASGRLKERKLALRPVTFAATRHGE